MPYKDPQKYKQWVQDNREKVNAYKTKYRTSPQGQTKIKQKYEQNAETIKATTRKHKEQQRFGGNRETAIQRDKNQCINCGITRQQHKNKYGKDITVDHIDGTGRNDLPTNNDLNNLQTLCLACHGSKDSLRYWLSTKQERPNG